MNAIQERSEALPGQESAKDQPGKGACEVVLGENWRVRPEKKLISYLGACLTPENFELVIGA